MLIVICSAEGAGRKKKTILDFEEDKDSKGSDFEDIDQEVDIELDATVGDDKEVEEEADAKPTPKQEHSSFTILYVCSRGAVTAKRDSPKDKIQLRKRDHGDYYQHLRPSTL